MKKRLLFFVILIIVVVFLCLSMLEVFLRLEGVIYNWKIAKTMGYNLKAYPHAFRIVCIGDSHTMGQGSSYGNDYPSLLQRILNERGKTYPYVVINQGRGGINSFELVNEMERIIRKSSPDLIIVMIGSIDQWSHKGLNPAILDEREFSLSLIVDASLSRLKIYKLLKVFIVRLMNRGQLVKERNNGILLRRMSKDEDNMDVDIHVEKIAKITQPTLQNIPASELGEEERLDEIMQLLKQAKEYQKTNRTEEAIQIFKQALSLRPTSGYIYRKLVDFYYDNRMIDDAIISCKELLKINPKSDWAYVKLAMIYREQNRYEEAFDTCREALKINPQNSSILMRLAFLCKDTGRYSEGLSYAQKAFVLNPDDNDCHGIMLWLYRRLGKYDKEIENLLRMNKSYAIIDEKTESLLTGQTRDLSDEKRMQKKFRIQDELTEKILSHNLKTAIRIVQENNVKIILCGYPQYYFPSRIMKKIAEKYGIPFLDAEKFFKQNIKVKNWDEYFNSDKHCNNKGYRMLAETIYQTLIKFNIVEGFLPSEPDETFSSFRY